MINLLSPDDRKQLSAARANSLLLRYTILLGVLLLVLIIEMGGAYLVLSSAKATSQATIDENERNTQAYAQTKLDIATFTSDLSTAKYILAQQVPYTAIILKLAAALPPEAVIDKLSVDPATFGTSTSLTVRTTSYAKAIDVKTSLQNAGLFSDVSFQSVTQAADPKYPFTASYNVTYSKDLLKQ